MSEKIINFAQYKESREQTTQEKFVESVESMLKHCPYADKIQSVDWEYTLRNGKKITTVTLSFSEDEQPLHIMDTIESLKDFIQLTLEQNPNFSKTRFFRHYNEKNDAQLIFTQ
jgi:hypothetical protein